MGDYSKGALIRGGGGALIQRFMVLVSDIKKKKKQKRKRVERKRKAAHLSCENKFFQKYKPLNYYKICKSDLDL